MSEIKETFSSFSNEKKKIKIIEKIAQRSWKKKRRKKEHFPSFFTTSLE